MVQPLYALGGEVGASVEHVVGPHVALAATVRGTVFLDDNESWRLATQRWSAFRFWLRTSSAGAMVAAAMAHHILFLPGAGGAASFWHPLGTLLPASWRKTYLSWPGLGHEPHEPALQGLDDAVAHAASRLESPSVVVAQSMGGLVAVRLALAHPERISHLILTATSGGVDVASFGASDWRIPYRAEYPNAAEWILTERTDLSEELHRIAIPTLLLWGDADPISPVGVGHQLARRLPRARLRVLVGGDHMFARDHASEIAPWIAEHLHI